MYDRGEYRALKTICFRTKLLQIIDLNSVRPSPAAYVIQILDFRF